MYPEWFSKLSHSFLSYYHSQSWIDLELRCSSDDDNNHEQQEIIRCHSLILALASPIVRRSLEENPLQDEILSFILPDVTSKSVACFIECLYSGILPTSLQDLISFSEVCTLFQIPVPSLASCFQKGRENPDEVTEATIFRTSDGDLVHVVLSQADEPCNDTTAAVIKIDDTPRDDILIAMDLCTLCQREKSDHETELLNTKDVDKRYKCCQCRAARISEKNFWQHIKAHLRSQSRLYHCKICHKPYSDQQLLARHILAEHPLSKSGIVLTSRIKARREGTLAQIRISSAQDVQCQTCQKTFKKKYYETIHSVTCGKEGAILSCNICKQSGFSSKYTLRDHIRSKHTEDRPCQCEYCDMRFSTKMNLYSHRVTKHKLLPSGESIAKKSYPCSLCGKVLSRQAKLNEHIKVVHRKEKPFRCKQCDKAFASKSNLKIHEGTFHTGILPYTCKQCHQSFPRKAALSSHAIKEHGANFVGGDVPIDAQKSGYLPLLGPLFLP